MGREVKRVPLDFAWPQDKIWEGFINPYGNHTTKCHKCAGTGLTPEAKRIYDQWYGYAHFDPVAYGSTPHTFNSPAVLLRATRNVCDIDSQDFYTRGGTLSQEAALVLEGQRLADLFNAQWAHHLNQDDVNVLVREDRIQTGPTTGWKNDPPTAQEVNDSCYSHDGINSSICFNNRCKREGITAVACPVCDGSGAIWDSPESERLYDEWESYEPPEGPGWQMWETVTEGSAISPVFKTPEALATWLANTGASAGGYETATYHQWLNMINAGWAPSAVGGPGIGIITGVEFVGGVSEEPELEPLVPEPYPEWFKSIQERFQ